MIKSHLYAIQFTRYSVVSLGLAELLYSTMLSSVCQVLFQILLNLFCFSSNFIGLLGILLAALSSAQISYHALFHLSSTNFTFFHLFLYGSTAGYCLLLYIFVCFILYPLDFHFLLRFSLIVSFFSDFLTFTLDRFRFPC